MKNSNQSIESILNQDIQLSETVERRLQNTYRTIEKESVKRRKSYQKYIAAAVLIFALTGTTAVAAYVSKHSELLGSAFGTQDNTSHGVKKSEIVYDDKGGSSQTIQQASEYIPMDEEKAKMIEPYFTDINKEVMLGKHKLTILNHVTDGHAGIVSYKLECSDGVDMIEGDDNEKEEYRGGAYIKDTSKYGFSVGDKDGKRTWSKQYFGIKKSTKNCYYLYESYVCDRNPGKIGVDCYERNESDAEAQKKEDTFVTLTGTEVPRTKVLTSDKKSVVYEYSSLGLSVDLSQIDEFKKMAKENGDYLDGGWAKRYVINYTDGTNYVVHDTDKNIDNTNCFYENMGKSEKVIRFIFNRVIDPKKVESITINDNINIKVK